MTIIIRLIRVSFVFLCLYSCKQKIAKKDISVSTKVITEKYTNDLVNETSPYLLQHAHNPVNWKPWGNEVMELAQKENKLIILSIGYSTCHWCHVMEEESFEDLEVAKLMNENYVSIKVDREERPDVDIVYQTALELVQNSGGWPLNAILLPDGKPVYLGTYHDKENWMALVSKFSLEYKNNPEKMKEYASLLTGGVQEVYGNSLTDRQGTINKETIENGVIQWSKNWDVNWGGNLGEQKFINPVQLSFLLDYAILSNSVAAKNHVQKTLNIILSSGIHDHIGSGFYRYTTDKKWRIPHFEKMLYDNAQIVSLYAKAYRAFKSPQYLEVVERTLDFIELDMKSVDGGYLSAIDADSDGEEGAFYVLEIPTLQSILGDDFLLFSKLYGIEKDKEWESGKYIPFKQMDNEAFAKANSISLPKLEKDIEKWKGLLKVDRNKRTQPKKDDKIITSWNALLVQGFVDAYKASGNKVYLDRAKNTFKYLLENNYKDGQLVHTFKKGSKQKEVFLEDFAFMTKSALELYKTTTDTSYFKLAKEFNAKVLKEYTDESDLFKYSAKTGLITKIIRTADGVIPSSNAIIANNLLEIGHIEYHTEFIEKSKKMVVSMSEQYSSQSQNYSQWGVSMLSLSYPYFEIVVVGSKASTLMKDLNTFFIPNSLLVGSNVEDDTALFKDRYSDNETLIYVCQNQTCKLPVKTIKESLHQLNSFGFSVNMDLQEFIP